MMDEIPVRGGHLEGRVVGSGEPALLVHGSLISDEWDCIERHPALAGFRLHIYRRRGYGGSARHDGPFSIEQQAEDAQAVLTHYGLPQAHVVGHSYGGSTVLQLAVDHPASIHTLSLLEPVITTVPALGDLQGGIADGLARYAEGDRGGAATTLLLGIGGDDPAIAFQETLASDWFDRAVADLDAFPIEAAALGAWAPSADAVRQIACPVLVVVGDRTLPLFHEGFVWVRQQREDTEAVMIHASHMLHVVNPDALASVLGSFLARHPMTGSTPSRVSV